MTKATYRRGPWTVDGPPHNQIVWSGAENRVCFLAHSNGRDEARDIATGHLIAAAPDLLECLKETLAIATRNEEGDFADRARAAIAKAEGRQP